MNISFKSLLRMAKADTVFYTLPVLMILLTAGTLAQRSMGLFDAHRMFFASFILWLGPIPLPAGYSVIGFLAFFLAIKFIFRSKWNWRQSGIILSHLGALVLLFGGLLTALTARESFMIINEGQQTPFLYDYHKAELTIFKNDTIQSRIDFYTLQPGKAVFTGLPFTLRPVRLCENCGIIDRKDAVPMTQPLRGMAQFMALSPKPREQAAETNLPGMSFEISGLDEDQNGLYLAFDAMPKPVQLKNGNDTYGIILGKQQRSLPFSIALKDFKKETYPGTDKARAFSSDIIVNDGDLKWPAKIEMNAPLRYKGYTFFQSSFEQDENGETTILSVVENKGRLFPYIGTLIIAAGLMLHIIMTVRSKP